jgi:(p)ppGpp synthase/HD superfamily hydrolase
MLQRKSEGLVFQPENLAEVIGDVRSVEANPKEEQSDNYKQLFLKILIRIEAKSNPEAKLQIKKAIELAVKVHADQLRKFSQISVLSHIISVAYIVSEVTNDVDTIVAAILHDVIEDSDPPITPEDLRKKGFSEGVISQVVELTEQKKEGDEKVEDKRKKWWLRKNRSVTHLRIMRFRTTIVKVADSTHFLRDLANDCRAVNVDDATGFFKVEKQAVMGRYQAMIQIIEARWPSHPLLPDMKVALKDMMDLLELKSEDLKPAVNKFIDNKEPDVEKKIRRVRILDRVRLICMTGAATITKLIVPF